MSTDSLKAAISRSLERFNTGDLDGYLQLYSDDVKAYGVAPVPLSGREALGGFYRSILGAFQPLQVISEDMIAEGDQVVSRFALEGRHTGEFMGTPASGRDFRVEGITILRFADGQCVERHSRLDFMGLLTQIGAIPS